MATWVLKEIREELFTIYLAELEDLEILASDKTKQAMVDPEISLHIVESFQKINNYVKNLNSALSYAILDPIEFYRIHKGAKTLDLTLGETADKVEKEQPGSQFVKDLLAKKKNNESTLEILNKVKEGLELPKARKRFKKWTKGIYLFEPFTKLNDLLAGCRAYIEENL